MRWESGSEGLELQIRSGVAPGYTERLLMIYQIKVNQFRTRRIALIRR